TGASIVPGTFDIGNHGDDVLTTIAFPFTVLFYGQSFTSATVSSNGNLQFSSAVDSYANACLPVNTFSNVIMPHWDDLLTSSTSTCPGGPCGIFTSTSGVAPSRIFNIEWRTALVGAPGQGVNMEVRLYEGLHKFDIIYGQVDGGGASATV